MIDGFIDWFLGDFMHGIFETIRIVHKKAFKIFCFIIEIILFVVVGIITIPLWLLPFIYWYCLEWLGEEDGKE